MAELTDAPVRELLDKPNHAVLSTINKDGSVHNAVVWLSIEDDKVAVNSRARPQVADEPGARPAREPDSVSIRTTRTSTSRSPAASARRRARDEHIDTLAQKYINQDKYPWRAEGEERVKFHISPDKVRYVKAA